MSLPPFDYNVLALMDDPIGLSQPGPTDVHGENTYGPPTYYRGKVEYEIREVRMNTGEERVSHANTYVSPVQINDIDDIENVTYLTELPNVTPEWQLTMPDGTTPLILRVDKALYGDMSHLLIYT